MGVTRFGAYTTHLACKADYVRPLPREWGACRLTAFPLMFSLYRASNPMAGRPKYTGYKEGAAFLCTALTAWYGLVKLGALDKDHTVLVHSAAGGVGLAALEIVGGWD